MKLAKLLLSMLVIALTILISCQKEFHADDPSINTGNVANVITTVSGRIVNELLQPVEGAMVKAGAAITTTDINGEFTIKNAFLYDEAAYVQVEKAGYFTGSRTFRASMNANQYIEVKLLPKIVNGTVSANTGGTVTLANGSAVSLPASSVVTASTNSSYSGNVNVSMVSIDPTGTDLQREMPGDLRGINLGNTEMGLQSFGMIGVELTGDAGERLQVAAGSKATIKFLLPAVVTASAPATIPLWSFNEATGLWKQEGTATKSGNFYTAEVSHFSFWNCDAQFPVVDFSATIKDQNGQPVKRKLVRIRRTVTNSYTTGYTDSLGVVKGKVPINEALTLEVVTSYTCTALLHTQSIGPFAAAANINVTMNTVPTQTATVAGTAVNCTGAPVVNGFADLKMNGQSHRAQIINGAFSIAVSICSVNQQASLTITDNGATQQSTPMSITLAPGAINAGTINACGTSLQEFTTVVVNGTTFNFAPPDYLATILNTNVVPPLTTIVAQNLSNSNFINFKFKGAAVGTFLISEVEMLIMPNRYRGIDPASTLPVTITEYGNGNGYVAGSFSGNVGDSTGSASVQVTFRVKQ
jgi:hypothetical protein